MNNIVVPVGIEMQAVVIRCGCGDPDSHNGARGGPRLPCPAPRAIDELELGRGGSYVLKNKGEG